MLTKLALATALFVATAGASAFTVQHDIFAPNCDVTTNCNQEACEDALPGQCTAPGGFDRADCIDNSTCQCTCEL